MYPRRKYHGTFWVLRVNQTSQPPQQVCHLWQHNTVLVKYLFSNFKGNINTGDTERIIS